MSVIADAINKMFGLPGLIFRAPLNLLLRGTVFMLLAGTNAVDSNAAKITVLPSPTLKCSIVRIKGEIKVGDFARFAKAILPLRRAIVELESQGGTVFDGIFVGKLIHNYGFWTTVRSKKTCASACALAWLGGSRRFIEKRGRVGFHAAYVKQKRKLNRSREANLAVAEYMKELDLSERMTSYATAAAPADMKWLTQKDALTIGLSVTFGAPPNTALPAAGPPAAPAHVPETNPMAMARALSKKPNGDAVELAKLPEQRSTKQLHDRLSQDNTEILPKAPADWENLCGA